MLPVPSPWRSAPPSTSAEPASAAGLSKAAKEGFGKSKLQFTAIKPVDAAVDAVTVPDGFTWQPVIRWGDPLFSDSPDFDINKQTAAAQARQFGYNNDYTDILEIPNTKGRRAVLFTNHEYTNENIMVPAGYDAKETRAIGRAAHGLAVVELERKNTTKPWSYVQGAPLNRRFLDDTTYELTGPVAGSALVKTVADPTGRPSRARSATAPAAPLPGAPSSPARRTSTATSWPAAPRPATSATA